MKKVVKTKRKSNGKAGQKNVTPYNVESMTYYMSPDKHVPVAFIEKFADDQLRYICDHEDIRYINEYYLTRGVNRKLYHDWCVKSKYFKDKHDMCLEIIGLRREKAMERASALVLKLRQHQYDPSFGIAEERDAEMKKRIDDNKMGDIKVVFPVNEQVIDREKFKPIPVGCDDKESSNS